MGKFQVGDRNINDFNYMRRSLPTSANLELAFYNGIKYSISVRAGQKKAVSRQTHAQEPDIFALNNR